MECNDKPIIVDIITDEVICFIRHFVGRFNE